MSKLSKEYILQKIEGAVSEENWDIIKELISDIKLDLSSAQEPYDIFGIECNYGWYGLILPILTEIKEYNKDKEIEDQVHILQIKEKFGSLCIYLDNAPEYIRDMVRKAEKNSYLICEDCGSPINVTTKGPGWIRTLCKECREYRNKRNKND